MRVLPEELLTDDNLSQLYDMPLLGSGEETTGSRFGLKQGVLDLDFSIFGYQFMQNAILSAFLGGIACATIGVFVVLMHMPFIGVCMSHAAFAGALLGLWLGFNPLIGAFAFSLLSAAIIGPLADRGELNPETSVGVIFSLMLGLAFLFMGLMPGTKSAALELLWGSILTNTRSDIILLGVVAVVVVGLVLPVLQRNASHHFPSRMALSVGIPATLILYGCPVSDRGHHHRHRCALSEGCLSSA